jgi:hypothetical protein
MKRNAICVLVSVIPAFGTVLLMEPESCPTKTRPRSFIILRLLIFRPQSEVLGSDITLFLHAPVRGVEISLITCCFSRAMCMPLLFCPLCPDTYGGGNSNCSLHGCDSLWSCHFCGTYRLLRRIWRRYVPLKRW